MSIDVSRSQGVQVGDHSTQINNFLSRRVPLSWPHMVGVVPAQADCFQYRMALDAIAAATADGDGATVWILTGLGGAGKTQIAGKIAREVWDARRVDLLVWISAGSREAIVSGYAQAATDIAGGSDEDAERAAERFLAWLAATDRSWLLVLDDLTRPSVLRGLWPPSMIEGQVIVTTRRRDTALSAPGRQLIEVGLFTLREAVAYLTERLGGSPDKLDQADDLARELGLLPLALAQATAYILDRDIDCGVYRIRFADRRRRLADLLPEDAALPDDHQATVASTWALSIEAAEKLAPVGLARPMIDLLSVLDGNGIPTAIVTGTAVTRFLAADRSVGSDTPDLTVLPDDAQDALHCLRRLNLIDVVAAAEPGNVRVHTLVQRATREQCSREQLRRAATAAADALVEAWPDVNPDAAFAQALRANTEALLSQAGNCLWNTDAHPVLFTYGTDLGEVGRVRAAASYYQRLSQETARRLGPDHPSTLAARGNWAHWQDQAGDHAGALETNEELLSDTLRILGEDHPQTLTTRNNLAVARANAGDTAGARAATSKLLSDQLRILGTDHRDTLATRGNLASLQGEAGDHDGARAAYHQLLLDRLRVLGPDDPATLNTRSQLAEQRAKSGDLAGAIADIERLLVDRIRVLGPDHPDTLTSRNNLAAWRGYAGDPGGAAVAFRDLLRDVERILGPDHPYTLLTRGNLAYWRGESGVIRGAVSDLKRLLADRLRIVGPKHPDTLSTRVDLAGWQGQAGDASEAATALEHAVADYIELLGPDHPDTLTTRGHLADWLGEAGDPVAAARECQQLTLDFRRVLGPDHINTLVARGKHATWLARTGNLDGAITSITPLLTDLVRVFGPNHDLTLTAHQYLADWNRSARRSGGRE